MHRLRKKDTSLKINRALDKKSNRGMVYENEELRIRTININEEVDRGHNDIRKLRKENDHLKREIWSLRDEYEKLELELKCIKKPSNKRHTESEDGETTSMMVGYNSEGQIIYEGGSSIYDDDFNEEYNDHISDFEEGVFDENWKTNSSFDSSTLASEINVNLAMPDDFVMPMPINENFTKGNSPSQHLWQDPGLEIVNEESENASSVMTVIPSAYKTDTAVTFEGILEKSSTSDNESPKIEITTERVTTANINTIPNSGQVGSGSSVNNILPPAVRESTCELKEKDSKDVNNKCENEQQQQPSPTIEELVELGCVSVVPKRFQITSELKIQNNPNPNNAITTTAICNLSPNSSNDEEDKSNAASPNLSKSHSPMVCKRKSPHCLKGTRKPCFHRHSHSYRHSTGANDNINKKTYYTSCSNKIKSGDSNTIIHALPILCQSEPCLNLLDGLQLQQGEKINFLRKFKRLLNESSSRNFNNNNPLLNINNNNSNEGSTTWDFVDSNIIIGVLIKDPNANPQQNLYDVSAQHIIDELEKQFDPTLENIIGVRVFPPGNKVFISVRSLQGVRCILEKSENKKLKIGSQIVQLIDGAKSYSNVVLSSIPTEINDSEVISILNNYGQVVAPPQRKVYKGIDISERLVRMHLIQSMPNNLLICGHQVNVKVQDEDLQSDLPHSASPILPLDNKPPNANLNLLNQRNITNSINNNANIQQLVQTKSNPIQNLSLPPPLPPGILNVNGNTSLGFGQFSSMKVKPQSPPVHKQVGITMSSQPRLESYGSVNPAIIANINAKRQMSVNGSHLVGSETSACIGIGKRPLTRLNKSSPAGAQIPLQPGWSINSIEDPKNGISRSLSCEPRQSLSSSIKVPMMGQIREARESLEKAEVNKGATKTGNKKDNRPLPWLGCWGNGCI